MFTGLVEQVGIIKSRELHGGSGKLQIKPMQAIENPAYGESIAINGVCLTLERSLPDGTLEFHAMEETFKRTNLGEIGIGGMVNLERAMRLGDRFGGHIVSGHVDGVGKVVSFKKNGSDIELKISLSKDLQPYLVAKGSICIDGISLTLVQVTEDTFTVHLIPVTLADTALQSREVGDLVNLETDLIGKYVVQQLEHFRQKGSNVTMDMLADAGFMD